MIRIALEQIKVRVKYIKLFIERAEFNQEFRCLFVLVGPFSGGGKVSCSADS